MLAAREKEFGGEVRFESWPPPRAIGLQLILVGVDHVRRRERRAQEGDGVGRPDIARKEQCPRQPPTGLDPDPEEVTFRAGSARSDEPDPPAVAERCSRSARASGFQGHDPLPRRR